MALNVGVIGCGSISKFHFTGLEQAGAKIAWLCDLSEDAARPYVEKYSARFTTDYRDIMNDPSIHLVDITTISSIHKKTCLAAIDAGKAVICEKTLAENSDDALEIVARAVDAGTPFYTSYMKRFIPAVQKAKQLLPSLGNIMTTHVRVHQCWGNVWETPDESTRSGEMSEVKRRYGGGILVCGGSHMLDLVLFLLGRPHRLTASMHTPSGRDVDAHAAALLETPSGVCLYEALAHPLGKIGFLKDGWDERIEISGTEGRLEILSAQWNQFETKASQLIHYDNATGASTEYRFAPISPFAEAVAAFCADAERGNQQVQSPLTGYEVDELIQHICRSAETHSTIDVSYRIGSVGREEAGRIERPAPISV